MSGLFVISGHSGVGKGTIIKEFLSKHPDFELSVSCTTRKPRDGELDKVNYFFLTKEQFLEDIKNSDFFEWAEFSGNLYGTKRSYILNSLKKGKNIILELDTIGALNVKKQIPEAILIFILPPSYKELEQRLRGRGTETEDAIQKRLSVIKQEAENAKLYDYTIINTIINEAVAELENIICNNQDKKI